MFGFFSAATLHEAATLMDRAKFVYREYATCDFDQSREKIRVAYGERAYIGDGECNFLLGDFQFGVSKSSVPAKITIVGKGRYFGLLVQTTDGTDWMGQASDGLAAKCTRDAKRLLAALRTHHGVFDYGRYLRMPSWLR